MQKRSKNQSAILSNQSHDWGSPLHLVQSARKVMGSIDTDPATTEALNSLTVKAEHFYTKADNGLAHPWYGNVWINPPFDLKARFATLAHYRYQTKAINQCCFLISLNSISTHALKCLEYYPVCLIRGRESFIPLEGQKNSQNTVNSVVYYMGEDTIKFHQEFAKYGEIRYTLKSLQRFLIESELIELVKG